jgi:RHS repeat-associated protein
MTAAEYQPASNASPTSAPAVDLEHRYDVSDQRVLKIATDPTNSKTHTVYIFESLELRRAGWISQGESSDYELTEATEVAYLFANGTRLARLAHQESSTTQSGAALHVFLELADHLGSTSVVLDQATGELVERSTYQLYGAAESTYRPERWRGFREDYRFTGKEEDVEVGLQYFGKRFSCPLLGRWASADPLGLHLFGETDWNLYAYVRGAVLKDVDPQGLDGSTVLLEKGLNAVNRVTVSSRAVPNPYVKAFQVGMLIGSGFAVGSDWLGRNSRWWGNVLDGGARDRVEKDVQKFEAELQRQTKLRDWTKAQLTDAFNLGKPKVTIDESRKQARFTIFIAANSTKGTMDKGWADEARKRGILAIDSAKVPDPENPGNTTFGHAEESLMAWVDKSNAGGALLGASFKMTRIGTATRMPCGPSEHKCALQLQQRGVPVDEELRGTARDIHENYASHPAVKNRTLAVAEVEVTLSLP